MEFWTLFAQGFFFGVDLSLNPFGAEGKITYPIKEVELEISRSGKKNWDFGCIEYFVDTLRKSMHKNSRIGYGLLPKFSSFFSINFCFDISILNKKNFSTFYASFDSRKELF